MDHAILDSNLPAICQLFAGLECYDCMYSNLDGDGTDGSRGSDYYYSWSPSSEVKVDLSALGLFGLPPKTEEAKEETKKESGDGSGDEETRPRPLVETSNDNEKDKKSVEHVLPTKKCFGSGQTKTCVGKWLILSE